MALAVSTDKKNLLAFDKMYFGSFPWHFSTYNLVGHHPLQAATTKSHIHHFRMLLGILLVQPKLLAHTYAHLLPLLYTIMKNIVFENTDCAIW